MCSCFTCHLLFVYRRFRYLSPVPSALTLLIWTWMAVNWPWIHTRIIFFNLRIISETCFSLMNTSFNWQCVKNLRSLMSSAINKQCANNQLSVINYQSSSLLLIIPFTVYWIWQRKGTNFFKDYLKRLLDAYLP